MRKNIIATIAFAFAMLIAMPANAQLVKFGVKVGANISTMSFTGDFKENFSAKNRAGFIVGPTMDLNLPLGFGADVAALYDNRSYGQNNESTTMHFISVPINVKYTLGLGSIASIYIATGPQFSFNVGKKSWDYTENFLVGNDVVETGIETTFKNSNFFWNVGAGITLAKHFRIGYTYNIPLGKTGEMKAVVNGQIVDALGSINLKNNTHQVHFTYIF